MTCRDHLMIKEIWLRVKFGICRCDKLRKLSFAFSESLKRVEALVCCCMISGDDSFSISQHHYDYK
jgi:hypothetical protein